MTQRQEQLEKQRKYNREVYYPQNRKAIRASAQRRYFENIEKNKEYRKKTIQHHPDMCFKSQKKWQDTHRQQYRAKQISYRLIPLADKCEICGSTEQIERHHREPLCCKYHKKLPAIKAIKEHGIECLLTGMTTDESETRGYLKRYDGCGASRDGQAYSSFYYYTDEYGCWKFNPIMDWTEEEVFEATKKLGIPLNEVYTKWNGIYKRCGCLPCTAYLDWERKLSRTHPAYYRWLLTWKNYTDSSLEVID